MYSPGRNGSTPPVRVGVIGLGGMGRHHARVYDDLPGAELVAVADCNPLTLEQVTRRRYMRGYLDYREMLANEDLAAVSVVVPTSLHHRVARDVIDQGIALLVEKPIAADCRQAAEMIEWAQAAHVPLAVGHVERFNPAVVELRRQLEAGALGQVFQIKTRRVGPFPDRVKDVGVAIDLATHDLDLMLTIAGVGIERLFAEATRNIHTHHEDMLSALLRFSDGTVGSLDVNWLTPDKVRDLTLVGARGMFVVDYLRQQLTFYENGVVHDGWDHLSVLTGVSEGRVIRLVTDRTEPLRAELASFVDCAHAGSSPAVPGEDGLRALRVAQSILESAATGSTACPDSSSERLPMAAGA